MRKDAKPKYVTVVPSPYLHPTEYVPGIPAVGRSLPVAEAEPLLLAGLVVRKEEPEPEKPAATEKEAD